MIYLVLGTIAFGLFIVYDLNSLYWGVHVIHTFFTAGIVVLTACVIMLAGRIFSHGDVAFLQYGVLTVPLILAIISFVLMIYSLFFALPFKKTYVEEAGPGTVCTEGMYALCRHPGVLWFCLFFLFASVALGDKLFATCGLYYSVLNIGYGVFQDKVTFMKILTGYVEYKQHTPFLIPNTASIKKAIGK